MTKDEFKTLCWYFDGMQSEISSCIFDNKVMFYPGKHIKEPFTFIIKPSGLTFEKTVSIYAFQNGRWQRMPELQITYSDRHYEQDERRKYMDYIITLLSRMSLYYDKIVSEEYIETLKSYLNY